MESMSKIEAVLFDLDGTLLDSFPDFLASLENIVVKSSSKKIEESVHKIKHKISILGLEKSYKIAEQHENNLREGNSALQDKFSDILNNVTNYLNKL